MTKLRYDQEGRYSSHAFRMGATNEIKNSGPAFAAIVKSGTWAAAGCKCCLDLQADEAINTSELLPDTVSSDINDTDPDTLTAERN